MTFLSLCLLSYSFSGQAVIIQFLASSMPPCLGHLDKQSAYLKTRTQLFNKRKSKQRNVAVILQFLTSSMPPCLGHLDKQSAYLKTRTQLFNKRKSKQRNVAMCSLDPSRFSKKFPSSPDHSVKMGGNGFRMLF